MADDLWVDTNILIRYITGDPPDMAERTLPLMRRAERGELTVRLAVIVVAELCWVLDSLYGYDRTKIADTLLALIGAVGIRAENRKVVLEALENYRDHHVDFVDAYLAAHARSTGPPKVCTFDAKHFRRLGVEIVPPDRESNE